MPKLVALGDASMPKRTTCWDGTQTGRLTSMYLISREAWKGTLVAFVDYDKTKKGEVVVIKINGAQDGRGMPSPLYLQFNRAKRMHSGTQSFRNLIVTVKGYSSSRIAALGSTVVTPSGGDGIALSTGDWRCV